MMASDEVSGYAPASWERFEATMTDDLLRAVTSGARSRSSQWRTKTSPPSTGMVDSAITGLLLERYLDTAERSAVQIGEASYWPGMSEYQSDLARWMAQPEFHFEDAICNVPGSDTAQKAFAMLHEQLLELHEAESQRDWPNDIQQHVNLLETLGSGTVNE